MNLEFISPQGQEPGLIASLLTRSYGDILASEPTLWGPEQVGWERYDREVFRQPETVGACIFLSRWQHEIVGFASWDPRGQPRYGVVGHNCVLPAYRGRGCGKQQIQEVLRRLRAMGMRKARVTTNDHPFFIPAQRMYVSCGFQAVGRVPWESDPRQMLIKYEREIP